MKKASAIFAILMIVFLLSSCGGLKKDTPDGYPYKFVPLYEGGNAYVSGSSSQSMKNYESFTVSVETEDDPDVVGEAIKDKFSGENDGGQSGDICSLGAYMISGEAGDWQYDITIESRGESGGSEITYFVKSNN